MPEAFKKIQPRTFALVAGLIAALLLGMLSSRALIRAGGLQDELNRGQALDVATETLTPLILAGGGASLAREVRHLVRESDLGITYLAVADAAGAILAMDGRFEQLALPLLSTLAVQRIRAWLYRLTSEHGTLTLDVGPRPVGRIDYAVSAGFAVDVRERAVSELRLVGWIGLLLALPTAAALAFAISRQPLPASNPALLTRVQGGGRVLEHELDEDIVEPEVTEVLRQHGVHALDALKRALIVVDPDARIRFMNCSATTITGWSAEDARGRLVYSVFHPLDEQQAPLVTPAETCLREGREYESRELWVRGRDGSVHAVEVMAALLRERAGSAPTGAAMVFHVIDDRRAQLDQLKRQSRLSQGVIDHLVEGVLTTDQAGVIRFANVRAQRMFGYARGEMDGKTVTQLLPVPFLNVPGAQLTDYVSGRHHGRLPRVVGWRKDDTSFPVELLVQPMNLEGSEGLVLIVRDITERMRSDNLAQRLGRLLDAAAEEVYIFDAQSLFFVEVNRGARRNLGYQPTELTRLTPLAISQDIDSQTFHTHLARLRGGEVEHITYRCRHLRADGSSYPVEVRLNFSREEEPPMYMAIAVDITEREADESLLRFQAQHDALTGLPNRTVLLDRLHQAVLNASRSSRQVGVFFVDLDRFKQVNDHHGHDIGDRVLEIAAQRISSVLRETDTLARLGGDEFVVVAQGLRGLDDAEGLARKILEAFDTRFEIPEHEMRVTCSIGVSLYPLDESDAEGLLRHADAAMYQAKQAGRGQYRVYSVEVPPEKRRRLDLDRSLHAAFALHQFVVRAQPSLDLVSGDVGPLLLDFVWQHPRQGPIPGIEVVEAAARAGLLADVELWQIYQACTLLPPETAADPDRPPVPVAVTISGWQLRDPEFSTFVFEMMERHRVPPRRLVFVLTRDGLGDAREAPEHLTRRLTERGVRLALCGSADSLFTALNRADDLPLDLVLLDAEEVRRAIHDAQVTERLRLVLLAAKGQGVPVMARGLADPEVREWLRTQGCRYGAGPLVEAPMEAGALEVWLAAASAARDRSDGTAPG